MAGRSSDVQRRVRETMAAWVERGVLPGCAWLVARGGEVHADAVGTTAFDGGVPMRRDSIFRITSMTKPVTSVATMMLVEEGKLRLDEPVDRLLPELANRRVLTRLDAPLDETVAAARAITVRDLLAFTMGFGLVFPFDTYPFQKEASRLALNQGPPRPQTPPAPDEWIRRLGTLPLMYQPGERWLYNTGSDVLGVLVARASGQPFDAFLRERIFAPLGMTDTAFHVPEAKRDRFTVAYQMNFATGALELHDDVDGEWSRPPAFPSGAAGLVSTVDDYHAFAAMLLAGGQRGRTRILSADSVRAMTTDQLTPAQKAVSGLMPHFFDTRGWGFGVAIATRPDELSGEPGRYGWDGGAGTYWFNDPARELVGILMTQRAFDGQHFPEREFWREVYGSGAAGGGRREA